jgi:transposase-like protein
VDLEKDRPVTWPSRHFFTGLDDERLLGCLFPFALEGWQVPPTKTARDKSKARELALFEFLFDLVHPEGLCCPRCGERKGVRIHRRRARAWNPDYRCDRCGRVFNAWTDTPLEKTHHSPSELIFFIEGVWQRKSTSRLARELHCHRSSLGILRRHLQLWIRNTIGPMLARKNGLQRILAAPGHEPAIIRQQVRNHQPPICVHLWR